MKQFPPGIPNSFGMGMRLVAAISYLMVAGCAHNDLGRLTGASEDIPFTSGKVGAATQFRVAATPVVLTRVQSAPLSGFDRLVFTFEGNSVPGYQLLLKPAGNSKQSILEIRMGARPNRPNGKPGIGEKQLTQLLDYPVIKGIHQERAGEEYVIWQASLAKPSDYRIQELTKPARLVIDLKQ